MLRNVLAFLFFVLITPFTFAQDAGLGSEDPNAEPGGGVLEQVAPAPAPAPEATTESGHRNTSTTSITFGKVLDLNEVTGSGQDREKVELIEYIAEYLGETDPAFLNQLRKEESKDIMMILQHWIHNK